MKKLIFVLLACLFVVSSEEMNAQAGSVDAEGYAFASFSTSISARSLFEAEGEISLRVGNLVKIEANYSPVGSLDVGLIDSDGIFHYVTVDNGTISEILRIEENGDYIFAIRNNSSKEIRITGTIDT